MGRLFDRVLLLEVRQVLTHRALHVSHFRQLLPRNAARPAGIRWKEAAIHGQVLALDQSGFPAAIHDLFKELLKEVRLLKASMTVLGKRRVMGNLLIEAESGKPAPGQMHLQFLDQLALAGDTIEIADQQDAQQEFRIDRGSACIAVGVLQLLTNEIEADVSVKETQ